MKDCSSAVGWSSAVRQHGLSVCLCPACNSRIVIDVHSCSLSVSLSLDFTLRNF